MKLMKNLARLFSIFGLLLLFYGVYLVWEHNNPNRLAFKNFTGNYKHSVVVNPPIRIVIADAHIDLPIFPALIKNGIWETTTQGASYLLASPTPGDRGNSIIYAHNWASLFGKLVVVHPGDKVEVDYQDGTKKFFTIEYTSVVPSDASGILSASSDKRITLYTCTGWFDTKRFVAVAVLD